MFQARRDVRTFASFQIRKFSKPPLKSEVEEERETYDLGVISTNDTSTKDGRTHFPKN